MILRNKVKKKQQEGKAKGELPKGDIYGGSLCLSHRA